MEIQNITNKQFNKYNSLSLANNIISTEAKLYIMSSKIEWRKTKNILKYFYDTNSKRFSNKLYTINELIENRNLIDIDELVFPTKLISINNELIGYKMPYIDNINLEDVLKSKEFSNEEKIKYLKELGKLLEKVEEVNKYKNIKFYLNDIHENNFVLNIQNGKINAVDLDSVSINNNLIYPSRYLSFNAKIDNYNKYEKINSPLGGLYNPDYNTSIYCYIVILLKYFYGENISNISENEYFYYLDYLRSMGVSLELIDPLSRIYSHRPNINPYMYLDELTPLIGKIHKNTYEFHKKKYY